VKGNADSLNIEAGGKNLTLGNNIKLENFTVLSNVENDAAGIQLRWNNWQDLLYKGNITALGKISRQEGGRSPHVEIDLFPATIITNDTVMDHSTRKYQY